MEERIAAEAKIKKLEEKYSAVSTNNEVEASPEESKPQAPQRKLSSVERDDVYFSAANSEYTSAKTKNLPSLRKQKNKAKNKTLSAILGVFLFFFSLLLVTGIALLIMIAFGKKDMLDYSNTDIKVIADAESDDDGKTVRYNGKIYRLNEDITSIACLGVDKEAINQNGVVGSAGQADTIIIIAFDTKTGEAKLLPIPRDTVAEIDVYSRNGSFLRTEETQICLAYAYGDGGKTSCENVVSAVKKVMFGMPIQSYAALDLKGIGPVNNSVGGVTVVAPDSFGKFKKGATYHLYGNQAMNFVRYRDTSKVESNLVRMNHQMVYIKAFTKTAVAQALKKPSMVPNVYRLAMNYAYTDIGLSQASYIASRFMTVGSTEFTPVSVPGKMVTGSDGYSEYYIKEKEFYETILSVYYNVIGTY